MSTDLDAIFNEQFININMKLKKRFMRKPNMSECAKEFIALAVQCENSDQPTFAGHAYVGAAKCEASAGNTSEEADLYVTAARQFMKAEKKLLSMSFYSPDRENSEAAIGCYMTALNKYPENSLLRGTLLMEMADDLAALAHKQEALTYYNEALQHIVERSTRLVCMRNKVDMEVDCEKFELALATAHAFMDTFTAENTKLPDSLLAEIQLYRILLSLLVKPSHEDEPQSMQKMMGDLMNDIDSDMIPFNPELRLRLQSIVSTATSGDVQSLVAVSSEAVWFLTTRQEFLLHAIIKREREDQQALT